MVDARGGGQRELFAFNHDHRYEFSGESEREEKGVGGKPYRYLGGRREGERGEVREKEGEKGEGRESKRDRKRGG